MKRERTSYAFLMEMIWVCAFFLICSSIFVLAFAKAEQISRRADVLNQAVQAASNTMETAFSRQPDSISDSIAEKYSTDDFVIELVPVMEDGLLTVTVTATDLLDGSILYTLKGSKAYPEGGRQ